MIRVLRYGKHCYWMAVATIRLLVGFALASRYFKTQLSADLQLPESSFFSRKEKRRLKHYFYGGTFLQLLFEALQPAATSAGTYYRLSNLAALAHYFDDLLELSRAQTLNGFNWKDKPREFGRLVDDHRQLALHFLDNLHQSMEAEQQVAFDQVMYHVFNSELAAKQQPPENFEQLQVHAAEKGGYSVLLFRQLAPVAPDVLEERALLEFGHLIQACDDIFDVWFDLEEQVPSFAAHLLQKGQLKKLKEVFEQQVVATSVAFRSCGFPKGRIETALRMVHYITAITRVCLKHYQQLEKKHGYLPLEKRFEMVVDMERWKNRLATAYELAFFMP